MKTEASFGLQSLRRAITHFLIGKGLTAPLTLLNILLLVRLSPVQEYGVYVTAFAVSEITLALTDLGLSWAAWRFVPSYRVAGGDHALRRFVSGILAVRTATLSLGAVVLWCASGFIASSLAIPDYQSAMKMAAVLVLVDGVGRFIREILFESLLLQGRVQISQMVRNVVLTVLLLVFWWRGGELSAKLALEMEIGAAAAASLLAGVLLITSLRGLRFPRETHWEEPDLRRMLRLMWPNYLSVSLTYLTGPQAMVALASRVIGADGAAVFGMAKNFVEQIRRYLPSELFAGVVRPAIIAAYEKDRSIENLNRYSQMLYKTSYVSLLPVIAVAAGVGGAWLHLITAGRYPDVHVVFLLSLCTLLPAVHRRVLEMVVNVLDSSDLWFKAALVGSLSMPAAYFLLKIGAGIEGMAAAILAGELLTNAVIIRGLQLRKYAYRVEIKRAMTALCSSLLIGLLTWYWAANAVGLIPLIALSALLVAAAALSSYLTRIFSSDEISMVRTAVRQG